MTTILAIDPGSAQSAWLQYDAVTTRLGYVPSEKRERKPQRQNQPINPFTGQMTW